MQFVRRLGAAILVLLLAAPRSAFSQERGAVALEQAMRGVTVTGRVLIIGAHPDDEDTQLIAWLARGRGVETAYLALTRGDGGQNIIGNELGESLGAIAPKNCSPPVASTADASTSHAPSISDFPRTPMKHSSTGIAIRSSAMSSRLSGRSVRR